MAMVDLRTGLYSGEAFKRFLAEAITEAESARRPYAVLAMVPQHLPGEGVADIVEVAASCVRGLMRDQDLAGRLDDEVIAIGLPDTDAMGGRVFAHRLQGDLNLRSSHLRNTVWEPGLANLGDDGWTANELLQAAIQASRTRRRRLGI